jgi:hypothetical protein
MGLDFGTMAMQIIQNCGGKKQHIDCEVELYFGNMQKN